MMEQSIGSRLAFIQRLLQRIEHKVGLHGVADPPAHDAAREDINDEGHVQPALPGRDNGASPTPTADWAARP